MATLIEAFGVSYSAGDIKVRLLDRTLDGISKIKYGSKQKKENLYGMGREPVQRGHGNKEYEGSITLKAFEMDALQKAAKDGDITAIKPFDVIVSYMDAEEKLIKTDVIKYVEFTGDVREIKSGDMDIECECELVIGKILRNT